MRHGSFHGRHCYLKATIEERKRQSAAKKKNKKSAKGQTIDQESTAIPPSHPFIRTFSESSGSESNDVEEAIRASVAATSHGNPEEDKMIERAIRASIRELHQASSEGDDKDAVQRAIQASVAEANRNSNLGGSGHASDLHKAGDHSKELEAALHRSLQEHEPNQIQHERASLDFDDSGVDTDDDENMKLALEKSKSESVKAAELHDQELREATEMSKRTHEEHEKVSRSEEEIVIEYIKRQSLAEEQHKESAKNIPAG